MELEVLDTLFAICRLDPTEPIPDLVCPDAMVSITITDSEVSLVCPENMVPSGVRADYGWCCLRVKGPLDLSLTGVLCSLAAPLAEAGVSIFAVSTFDTDYVLLRELNKGPALAALARAGHVIAGRPSSG
jgi:hypothetical protein